MLYDAMTIGTRNHGNGPKPANRLRKMWVGGLAALLALTAAEVKRYDAFCLDIESATPTDAAYLAEVRTAHDKARAFLPVGARLGLYGALPIRGWVAASRLDTAVAKQSVDLLADPQLRGLLAAFDFVGVSCYLDVSDSDWYGDATWTAALAKAVGRPVVALVCPNKGGNAWQDEVPAEQLLDQVLYLDALGVDPVLWLWWPDLRWQLRLNLLIGILERRFAA